MPYKYSAEEILLYQTNENLIKNMKQKKEHFTKIKFSDKNKDKKIPNVYEIFKNLRWQIYNRYGVFTFMFIFC